MKDNFAEALEHVLKHEGGYVNHPSDPGGMTNLGVTKRVWEEWIGRQVDEKTMRELTPAVVGPMYRAKYWDKVKGDELPTGVDYVVFDAAVNSGPGRAAKWLQACVGVEPDGGIGPKTLAAVAAFKGDLVDDYSKRRLSFLMDLPHWPTFSKGWSRRVAEVRSDAATFHDVVKPVVPSAPLA
jgi:lysozyme family protein